MSNDDLSKKKISIGNSSSLSSLSSVENKIENSLPPLSPLHAKQPDHRPSGEMSGSDYWKSFRFIGEAGGSSAAGAALFWGNVIFKNASPNGKLVAGISAGSIFFLATGILVGFAYYRAKRRHRKGEKVPENTFLFWTVNILNTIGLIGLLIGANYFFWQDYVDFKDLSHLAKPIDAKGGIFIGIAAFLSLIYLALTAIYLIYMKNYIRKKAQKTKLEPKVSEQVDDNNEIPIEVKENANDTHTDIKYGNSISSTNEASKQVDDDSEIHIKIEKNANENASISSINELSNNNENQLIEYHDPIPSYSAISTLKDIGLDLDKQQEKWKNVLSSWKLYIKNTHNLKTVKTENYGIEKSGLRICAIMLGVLNAAFGAINAYSFAKLAFGDITYPWSLVIQIIFVFVSASLLAVFFTKDFAAVSEDFHYKIQEDENTLVIKEGKGFENIMAILDYMLEYQKEDNYTKKSELFNAILEFLKDDDILTALEKDEKLRTHFFQRKNKRNTALNVLIISGLVLQFVGAYYTIIKLDYFKGTSIGKSILFSISLFLLICGTYDALKNKRSNTRTFFQIFLPLLMIGACCAIFATDYVKGIDISKPILLGLALLIITFLVLDAVRLQSEGIRLESQNSFDDLKKAYNELKENINATQKDPDSNNPVLDKQSDRIDQKEEEKKEEINGDDLSLQKSFTT